MMRKSYFIIVSILIMAFSSSLFSQTVTVGTGSVLGNHPIYCYYGYTYSQSIYLQSEIATAGNITTIRFQYTGSAYTDNITVYMGHTTKTAFANTTDWVPVGSMTNVYSGNYSYGAATGWYEITLTTPFAYNNTDNLVIAVDENTAGYHSSSDDFYNTTVAGNRSIYYYSDATNPNPASPPTASATTTNIANVQLVFTAAGPMTYSSSTVTQASIASTLPGSTNQEVICMQVVTSGTTSPLSCTNFRLRTTGSTDPVNDIQNAKIWYTGNSSTFATTTQFGATYTPVPAIGIDYNLGGSQVLSPGTNYFWLTYDIKATATLGNVVDALCNNITVDAINRVPTVTTPAGNRPIALNYCNPAPSSVDGSGITNITCGTINNTTGTETNNYGDYSAMVATFMQSTLVTVNITYSTGFTYFTKIWVDWNNDGDFVDAGEEVYSGESLSANPTTLIATFVVPITASPGNHRMRIGGCDSSTPIPCYTGSYGSYEDYTLNVTAAAGCAGTPTAGTTSASPNPICSGSTSLLTLSGYTVASGITFQWQSAPAAGGPWTNIGGATSITYTTPALTTNTFYRCVVTCTNSGLSANSTSTEVSIQLIASCYCVSSATSTSDMDITQVRIDALNNTSPTVSLVGSQGTATGTAGMYSNFWGSGVPIPDLEQGSTYAFRLQIGGTAYSHRVDVYIDFNQDGDLVDAGESFVIFPYANPSLPNTTNTNITIPITALTGSTLMRVVCVESSSTSACGTYTWGETEDYQINITAAPPCAGTPTAGTTSANPNPICAGTTSLLTLTGYTIASGITFQWQSAPAAGGPWTNIGGATSVTYTTPALTASTYYRCVVTCTSSGLSANSTSTQVVVQLLASCYCASSATSTLDMDITNITFGTINNTTPTVSLVGSQGTATGTAGMYSDFWGSGVPIPSIMQGQTVPFSVTIGGTAYGHAVYVFIDFNQDGDLVDAGESFLVFPYANPILPNTTNANITIPITATTGNTLMRVLCVESSSFSNPCGTYTWGETEDYVINITAASACAGTPTAGTATASPNPICAGSSTTVSLSGYTVASGITFQWQSAPAAGGPWTNIVGATSLSYITPALSVNTFYRCVVTCTNSGLSANSTSVEVVIQLLASCYCISTATSTSDMDITNITLGTINNTTPTVSLVGSQGTATGTAGMYSDFWGSGVPIPSIMQGQTVPFSVTIGGTAYSHAVYVFIDFNQDGDLVDAGESFLIFPYANPSLPNTTNANITIPITATTGNTLMRVVCVESSTFSNPCGTYTWGETEDYTINIALAPPCAGTPTAGTTSVNPSPVCPNSSAVISLTGYSIASGIVFQWQSSPDNSAWTDITGANGVSYTTPALTSSTYYRCRVTCSSSGLSANSTSVQAVVSLTSSCYCVSSATSTGDMDIGNVTFGTINNTSACISLTGTQGVSTGTAGMYSNFCGTGVPIPNCERGILMPISVTIPVCGSAYGHAVYVFIDYNQDGDYTDLNEKTTIFAYANPGTHTINSTISIPSTAVLGNTTMRILCVESSSFSNPCGTYTWGETEDYTVNIIAGVTSMAFVSCTATQLNTSGVGQGSVNKEIICLEVVTSGMLSPISVTEFQIRTDGTTNVNDIENAKIWYTGNSGAFNTTTQFGTTVAVPPAPGTTMLFNGALGLTGGTNYFWLSYDIKSGATVTNVVDAVFRRATIGGSSRTPTTTAPAGSRPITPPLPPNDEPCGAIPLAVGFGGISYQTGDLTTTTTASTGIPAPGCSSLGPDIWFTAVVPASGRLIIDMDDSGGPTDMGMAWYTSSSDDCNNIDNLIECDDNDSQNGLMSMICRSGAICTVPGDCSQNAILTPGTTVYVRVWEYGGGTFGTFLIGAYDPGPGGAPSTCITASIINSLPYLSSASTCCSENTYTSSDGCGSLYQDGEDYLYSYTPSADQIVDIMLSGTSAYTGIFVTDACPDAVGVNCIASQTASGGNPMLCGVSLTAGTTYFFMVDTDPGPSCTPFSIRITASSSPTCNMSYTVATTTYSWDTYFGTNIVLPIDDRFCDIYIPLAFPICYDGYQYTGMLVSSNGYLIFDPISCATNLPTTNAAPNTYSGWSINAAIPNTTDAPRNAILGPWHDIDPAQGGAITYGILGTAPNRRFIVTWSNAPLFSSSCGQLISQQIKLFEATNDVEIHLRDKVSCAAWNGGAAIMGIHNYNGTMAVVPAGYNYPTLWSASNEAWKFTYSCTECITPVVLPVEFITFEGESVSKNSNALSWITATEINNDFFEVQKMVEKNEYETIGFVKGSGNSNQNIDYEFTDNNVDETVSYYRLKQVDFDGSFKYTHVIAVSSIPINSAGDYFYPNPAKDFIYFIDERAYSITTIEGKHIMSGQAKNADVSGLAKGIYLIKVGETHSKLIID